MKKRLSLFLFALGSAAAGTLVQADGLPKASVQLLIKALQDTHVDVRTAAAVALAGVPDSSAAKPLEAALIASADKAEQDALVSALTALNEKESAKRLSDAVSNPQFSWGANARPRAVEVVGRIGQRKAIPWLTTLGAGDADPAVRTMAIRLLGELGAPPKKEK